MRDFLYTAAANRPAPEFREALRIFSGSKPVTPAEAAEFWARRDREHAEYTAGIKARAAAIIERQRP
jgi:hypothetical protein